MFELPFINSLPSHIIATYKDFMQYSPEKLYSQCLKKQSVTWETVIALYTAWETQ